MVWMASLMLGCMRRRTSVVRGDMGGNSWSFSCRVAERRKDGGSWSGTMMRGRCMVAGSVNVGSRSLMVMSAGASSRSWPTKERGEETEDLFDTWSDIYLWMGQACLRQK